MRPGRPWTRRARRAVTPIIAASVMVGITITAGTALWELKFHFPAPTYYVTYVAKAGIKIPAWGDPTDCIPWGYPISLSSSWSGAEWNAYWNQCFVTHTGNYSRMNASEIIVTSASPPNIPLSLVNFYFFCHNTTPYENRTILVGGSLAAMTWFPGSTTSPAPNAPHLGWCATFDANGYGGGAFGTLYNRLGIFVPVHKGSTVLSPGDTIIIYVHTKNSVFDANDVGGVDSDDYHGAPSWCFTTPGACYIQLEYMGTPQQLLATIPIYSISGQAE